MLGNDHTGPHHLKCLSSCGVDDGVAVGDGAAVGVGVALGPGVGVGVGVGVIKELYAV